MAEVSENTPPAPHALRPAVVCQPEFIPDELKAAAQWIVWQLRPSADGTKPRKIPIDARTEREARTNDPGSWASFEAACQAITRFQAAGLGFVLTERDRYCGIDLDDCINADGTMQPWAAEVVRTFDTYTEISQSGRGVKLLFRAVKRPGSPCKGQMGTRLAGLECYDRGRYFALTGVSWNNAPCGIAARQGELDHLLDELERRGTQPKLPATGSSTHSDPGALVRPLAPHGAARAPLDAIVRASRYLAKMSPSVAKQRGHDRAFAAATVLVHGFCLEPGTALELLRREFNPRCTPPWSEKELQHKVHDARTKPHRLPSGWLLNSEFAMKQSRSSPGLTPTGDALTSSNSPDNSHSDQNGVIDPPGAAEPPEAPECPRAKTDAGNAERFADQWSDQLRYCHKFKAWFEWDGKRWREDESGAPQRLAIETARSISSEADSLHPSERHDFIKWGLRSEHRMSIDAMVSLARSMLPIVVLPKDLDRDPWLFNVLNGTIDLRSGRLLPHRREDLITLLAPVEYDQSAVCPRFDAFLNRILPDATVAEFVLRFLGHALTGDVSEQILPIFHGKGANGKSVLMDTVMALMGGYAGQAPPALLVVSSREEHPTELADLHGKRLVVASETEYNAALKVQLVKKLTGDSTVKARRMHKDYFEFMRTHKMVMVTNNAPRVVENSEAIWRRLQLVAFGVVIPEKEQDKGLLAALRSEWPGILNRLIWGCMDWQEEGLGLPESVQASTSAYRESEDVVGRFLADACCVDLNAPEATRPATPWTTIFAAYQNWCEENGEQPLAARRVGELLTSRGIVSETKRVNGKPTKCRIGVGMCYDASSKAL